MSILRFSGACRHTQTWTVSMHQTKRKQFIVCSLIFLQTLKNKQNKTTHNKKIKNEKKVVFGAQKRFYETSEQNMSFQKRNKRVRRALTMKNRHLAKELLYGRDANAMFNKLSKGGNQKKLQEIFVKHMYGLKLNMFRYEFDNVNRDEFVKKAKKKAAQQPPPIPE